MMTPALDLQVIAQYSALRIIESLAEGAVIFAFAATLLRIVRHQNAGTRFAVWFSALVAIAVSPVIGGIWSSEISHSGTWLRQPAIMVPDSWAVYLFAGWGVIAGWLLLGVARAIWRLRALRKSCTPVDPSSLDSALRETLRLTPSDRPVSLCTSEQVRVPTAIGLAKPMIVVPRWVIEELSVGELKQIFLHEMAHLRRRDDWTNLLQQVVKAVFFFHPAVWWIEKNVALEREIACDDAVLAETESPRAYAECLAHLAERSFIQRSIALAQAALGRIRQTSARVAQILDGSRPKGTRTWKPAVSMVAGFAIVFSIAASRFQRVIAFQDDSPAAASRAEVEMPASEISGLVHNATYDQLTRPRATEAKLRARSEDHRSTNRLKRAPAVAAKPKTDGLIHLANSKPVVAPVQETLVVFIQGIDQSAAVDGVPDIQMWRVTVLRYLVKPASSTAPRKQI